MEYKDESIILRVKEVMKENGLTTQTDLEKAVGVSQSTISAIFKLNRSSLPLIEAINKKMHISKSWLLTGNGMKFEAASIPVPESNALEMTNADRIELLKKLNDLYTRHQKIMDEAQEIMKTIVEIDKKILLSNLNIAE